MLRSNDLIVFVNIRERQNDRHINVEVRSRKAETLGGVALDNEEWIINGANLRLFLNEVGVREDPPLALVSFSQ